jgi:hypothetical protein
MDATRASVAGTHAVPPGTLPPLPGTEAAAIGLLALAIMMFPLLWPLAEHFNVMAHEGAHTVVGTLMGFTLVGVKLKKNAEGETEWDKGTPNTGLRRTLTRVVGYLGPSGFGLGAAKLIETGHIIAVLWIAIVLLAVLLYLIRDSFGVLSVPVAIALIVFVMRYAHGGLEEAFTYLLTWVLLLSGVRVAVKDGAGAGDADNLYKTTNIPRVFWAWLWLAGTVLAVVIGGKWLVLRS